MSGLSALSGLLILLLALCAYASSLEFGSCSTSAVWNMSCSPKFCIFDDNVACLFANPSWDYKADLAALSCKSCTPSTALQCKKASLQSTLKVGFAACIPTSPCPCIIMHRSTMQSPAAQIKAAYCNDKYLVIHSNGQPNHQAYLDNIPTPPGAGGRCS